MASKKGGLGKGLGALGLAKPAAAEAKDAVTELEVTKIRANRYQPRTEFDEAAMEELAESVKVHGVIQPIIVRRLPDGGYELIAGERRLRAARQAEMRTIPALIREYNDAQMGEIALIENIQRENLNALEEAHAYERLLGEFHLTQEQVAAKVGRSRSHIANFLRLLRLSKKVQDRITSGTLSMGQAKPLLALDSAALQEKAAAIIEENELSSRQAEALVKRLAAGNPEPRERTGGVRADDVFLRDALEKLKRSLGTQVYIKPGKKKSRIEIEFYSEEDLERILETVTGGESAGGATHRMTKEEQINALREVSTRGTLIV